MARTMVDPGMPRKVLAKAQQLGVHNDCLVSENLCPSCSDNVMLAFDFFYADAKSESELLIRLIEDLKADMEEDFNE